MGKSIEEDIKRCRSKGKSIFEIPRRYGLDDSIKRPEENKQNYAKNSNN